MNANEFMRAVKYAIEHDNPEGVYTACLRLAIGSADAQVQLDPVVPGRFHEAVRDGLNMGRVYRAELFDVAYWAGGPS